MADRIITEPKPVEELIVHGYHIRPMEYLREGWRTFTRYPTGFLGFALLFTVASQAPLVLGHVYGQFLSALVQVIMMAGIAMAVWKQMRSDPISFVDFFPDWDTIGHLILCTIVGLLLIAGGLLLFVLPGIYLIVAYTFAYMLIIDRGFSVWQALETSRRVVNKNWWKVAGLTGLMVALMAGGTAVFSLMLGLPLGAVLSQYYPEVSLSDLPFGPSESGAVVNMGMMIGVASGAMMGLGLGTALAGCMFGVAYADIFGLTARRVQAVEPFAQKLPTVSS
ncbi:MAG TPA: hypothetical protein VGJ57_09405 [Nitrospirales bacterium]|jgi:hypothetical protein